MESKQRHSRPNIITSSGNSSYSSNYDDEDGISSISTYTHRKSPYSTNSSGKPRQNNMLSGSIDPEIHQQVTDSGKFPLNFTAQSILFWAIIILAIIFLIMISIAFYYYRQRNLCSTTPTWCFTDWVCPDRNPYQESKRIRDELVRMASQENPQIPQPASWLANGRVGRKSSSS